MTDLPPLHDGSTATARWIGTAPAAIGPLVSHFADITEDGKSPSRRSYEMWARVPSVVVFVLQILLFATGAYQGIGHLAGLALVVLLAVSIRKPTTTFVGEQGLARLDLSSSSNKSELVRFEDVSDVLIGLTQRDTGVFFCYLFRDARGKTLFRIVGTLPNARQPGADSPFHFAVRAEQALLAFLLPRKLNELEQGKDLVFAVSKKEKVIVRRGEVEFHPEFGSSFSVPIRCVEGPRTVDHLIEFEARRLPETAPLDPTNPYQAPRSGGSTNVRFEANELPNRALLGAILDRLRSA